MQRDTYCSGTFLERFYQLITRVSFIDSLQNQNTDWMKELYRFLHSGCNLITDIEEEEILRRSDEKQEDYNPHYRRLWSEGRKRFISYPDTFDQMEIDEEYFKGKVSEIFLLGIDKEKCGEIEKLFGVFCSSASSIEDNIPERCLASLQSISKSKNGDWSFLEDYRYPSNAAVIVDNYILTKPENRDENLYAILDALLPEDCGVEYHLTLLTKFDNGFKEQHKKISKFLESNYKYPVLLSIAAGDIGPHRIHDRDIITNYCWYKSGAGFNLFKKGKSGLKSIHNTDVSVYPAICVGNGLRSPSLVESSEFQVHSAFDNTMDNLKRIWGSIPNSEVNLAYIVGPKKNRILDE